MEWTVSDLCWVLRCVSRGGARTRVVVVVMVRSTVIS
jgi:hypothetical protein